MANENIGGRPRKSRPSVLQRLRRVLAQSFQNSIKARRRMTADFKEENTSLHAQTEDSAAKFWSIYITEAERYDSALVESWRADMEGMLIFSGLFSASLTAFLVESYKFLVPDSGDTTVALLSQISHQLGAHFSGSELPIVPPVAFIAPTSSLICNGLWFVSLGLSLTCALLATLVEQWAREFLHKTEIRPSPVRRARVFSFLYYGISRFGIHAIVDAIPLLLHLALVLFFAGLIAFLIPISQLMTSIVASVLSIFLALYGIITVLPVVSLDCPYRTPLSDIFWRLVQNACILLAAPSPNRKRSLTDAVLAAAMQRRDIRDERAVLWTLELLTDNTELLPFVEATHDIIVGPAGFRRVDDHLFRLVLQSTDSHTSLPRRIVSLLWSAQTLPASDPLREHRRTAGLRALWALAFVAARTPGLCGPLIGDGMDTRALRVGLSIPPKYRISLDAAITYMRCRLVQARLEDVRDAFTLRDIAVPRERRRLARTLRGVVPQVMAELRDHGQDYNRGPVGRQEMIEALEVVAHAMDSVNMESNETGSYAAFRDAQDVVARITDGQIVHWALEYAQIAVDLVDAAFNAGVMPYKLLATSEEILPVVVALPGQRFFSLASLAAGPEALPNSLHGFLHDSSSYSNDLDALMRCALRLLPVLEPATLMPTLHWYLSSRISEIAVFEETFKDCDFEALADAVRQDVQSKPTISSTTLCGLVTLCLWKDFAWKLDRMSVLDAMEASLQMHGHPAYATLQVILETSMLESFAQKTDIEPDAGDTGDSNFPTTSLLGRRSAHFSESIQETPVAHPAAEKDIETVSMRTYHSVADASDQYCVRVSNFLSACNVSQSASWPPYKAASAVEYLFRNWPRHLRTNVGADRQRELAQAVRALVQFTQAHPERQESESLVKILVDCLDVGLTDLLITDEESVRILREALSTPS